MQNPPKMPNLQIRAMKMTDLDRVLELASDSFADPWSRNNFAHEILRNNYSFSHVVLNNGEIIGYSVCWYFDLEAHLANFAVDRRYRRQNVGSYLLGYIISDILQKNICDIYLEVRAENRAARSLYLKHGFQEDGVRKNYYSHVNDDAILMSLSLQER
ncbi:MAG: ribosomal protein S18-alanine N-acetyltransferase [bacterium]